MRNKDFEATENIPLIDALVEAKNKSGVSYEVLAALIGRKKNITHKYLTKKRNLTHGKTERRAAVAVSVLNSMVDDGILPLKGTYRGKTEETLKIIEDFLAR